MRVKLLHKLAEHIPEDYVPPQKLIADVGKMVSDARDAGGPSLIWRSPYSSRSASSRKASGTERRASRATEA